MYRTIELCVKWECNQILDVVEQNVGVGQGCCCWNSFDLLCLLHVS